MAPKRKHVALAIEQKVEILRQLDAGESPKDIQASYNIGKSTVYDIKSARKELLEYSDNAMKKRKTIKDANFPELNKAVYEWFKQRRRSGFPISVSLLKEKAKQFHDQLNIVEPFECSNGWIRYFKARYGIRSLHLQGEQISADFEAAEEYVETFAKLVRDEHLTASQITLLPDLEAETSLHSTISSVLEMAPKRKHVTLAIEQKVEILRKLDAGETPKSIQASYNIGRSTLYNIKAARKKLLEFYSDAEYSGNAMKKRKTIKEAKFSELNKAVYEWFKQRRRSGFPISISLLKEKAKQFRDQLNIVEPFECSNGWLRNFKARYGIRSLLQGEQLSTDFEAAEEYVETFAKLVRDENLTASQIYNAEETGVFWRCIPSHVLAGSNEQEMSGCKESKERITTLACANASGTHKCKLLVIGKSQKPRCLKDVQVLPVIYHANKRALITRDLTLEWFHKHFVLEARENARKEGLAEDCKILLLLDNCWVHPNEELLVSNNVYATYLPPNCTSLIQPMDQGVIRSMKCFYRKLLMGKLLTADNVDSFKLAFNIKECLWALAQAWDSVEQSTLRNAWHNLWPISLFNDQSDTDRDFDGFSVSRETMQTAELLRYAKSLGLRSTQSLDDDAIEEWVNCDRDVPTVNEMTDQEILEMVSKENESDDDSDDENESETKISLEKGIQLGVDYLKCLEQHKCISEHELLTVYRVQEKLIKAKTQFVETKDHDTI